MTRKPMAVVGVVGFTLLTAACSSSSGTSPKPTTAPAVPEDKEVRDYLSLTGPMYAWEVSLSKAVCNLEKFTTTLPTGGDRYCPGNGDWPPSGTPPPKFPPGP